MALQSRLDQTPGIAQTQQGIGLTGFITALSISFGLFVFQITLFLVLRNKKAFQDVYGDNQPTKEKDATSKSTLEFLKGTFSFSRDRNKSEDSEDLKRSQNIIVERCGLDAYFFLRYIEAILDIFRPILLTVMPVLLVLNFIDGKSQDYNAEEEAGTDDTRESVIGLDTFAFGNVRDVNTQRYAAHAVMAVVVVFRFSIVVFRELQEYIERRQQYFRKRQKESPDANLVLVSPCRNAGVLKTAFSSCYGGIKRIQLIPDMRRLVGLLRRRESMAAECEVAGMEWMKAAAGDQRGSESSGEKDVCWDILRNQDSIIEKEKKALKADGVPACSALVQFRSTRAAHSATTVIFEDNPFDEGFILRAVSAEDVVLSNIGITWLQGWIKGVIVDVALVVAIVLWAIPVAATAALSQVDALIQNQSWLAFIQQNTTLHSAVSAIAGVLPAAALSLLLYMLPIVLGWLARIRGVKLHSQEATFIQRLYFIFLFVQTILVVSVASFFTASLPQFLQNIKSLDSVGAVFNLLSRNLPSAANYFFSYLALQALGRSSGIVLELQSLAWSVWDKVVDHTPMQKWRQRQKTGIVAWASDFPVYTTFACIGLVYSIIAPLVSAFVVFSFELLRLTNRYSILHKAKPDVDYGGILYPQAIHQTFVGVYFMLACLAGLFFGVHDQLGRPTCVPHGVLMILVLFAVAAYQATLHSVLLRHSESLPESDAETETIMGQADGHVEESHPLLHEPLRALWVPILEGDAQDSESDAPEGSDGRKAWLQDKNADYFRCSGSDEYAVIANGRVQLKWRKQPKVPTDARCDSIRESSPILNKETAAPELV